MIRIFGIFIFFCSISLNGFAFQNEPDGFRGVKWGTDIADLPRLELKMEHEERKIYTIRDDDLKIGGAIVREIEYYFLKDRFYEVLATTSDLTNAAILRQSCIDNFGDKIDFIGFDFFWKGAVTRIFISEPTPNGNAMRISSTAISNELSQLRRMKELERAPQGF